MKRMLLGGFAVVVIGCGSTGQVPQNVPDDTPEASVVPHSLHLCDAGELTVDTVTPSKICPGVSASVTITGSGFLATPTVFVREPDGGPLLPTTDVVAQSSTSLTAVVTMPGIVPIYDDLVVVNPDGCTAVMPSAFYTWCEGPKP